MMTLSLLSRTLLPLVACASFVGCGVGGGGGGDTLSEGDLQARAREIHHAAITMDTHIDIGGNYGTPEVDPCVGTNSRVDIPKMLEGDMDVAFLAVYVGQGPRTPEGHEAAKASAMNKFAAIHRVAEEMCPDKVEIAYTPDDVERIHATGKRIISIGIENGYPVGHDLSLVEEYYNLGARYITLTHNGHNDIADSTNPRGGEPEEEHGGLSDFGREVVKEMNRLGIFVDVSHASRKTMMQAIELSEAPIMASHSGVSGIADVSRNLNDEQLLALKENGGVIQIVALGGFLQVDPPGRREAMEAVREELGLADRSSLRSMNEQERAAYMERIQEVMPQYEARMAELDEEYPRATVQTMVDHIDYVVDLIGIDHVGIGTDFDGGGGVPGFNDAREALNLTVELVRRGYNEEEIRKIWGGNLLRAWREVERISAEMQG
ncbi:MAG: membrane dipeptidase [Gemmatimonadetes bacterium]|nr:dipeptidase [Gemmatimonadota bacterium]NNM07121.1 membrane dipeptidase [Gemmatimonadota bacterium]